MVFNKSLSTGVAAALIFSSCVLAEAEPDTPTGHGSYSQAPGGKMMKHKAPAEIIAMYTAHAVLACMAWAFIFPLGGIMIRLLSFKNLIWVHAGLQIFGLCCYTAAVGLGVKLSINPKYWRMDNKHVIIGLTLFALFLIQPITGLLHHIWFKKYVSRTTWSYIHLWAGRLAVTLGMINAGFGFQLTHEELSGWRIITYTVFAVIVYVAYVASIIVGERRRKREAARLGSGATVSGTDSGSDMPREKETVAFKSDGPTAIAKETV